MGNVLTLSGFVTFGSQTLTLGVLPVGASVKRVHIDVLTGFNGDGTDQIQVGHDDNNDAFATATDVSATGYKSVTLGAEVGYVSTSRPVKAYYVNGSGEPTTGKALIEIEYTLNPRS